MPRGVYDRSKSAEKHAAAPAASKGKPGPKPGYKKPGPKPGAKYNKTAAATPAPVTTRFAASPSVDGDAGRRLDILLNYQALLAQHEKGSQAYLSNLVRLERLAEVVQTSKEIEAVEHEEEEAAPAPAIASPAPAFTPVPVPQNAAPYVPGAAPAASPAPAITHSSAAA